MEPLESKLQQEKLFQTAIVTHQHVFYFRFKQVPQNARLPHPPHPTEIQPGLICFPFRSRGKGWQLGQVPALFRALFATSEGLWPSARWFLGLPGSTLPLPWHSLTLQLTGDTEAEQVLGRGTWLGSGTVRLGWFPHRGLERGWGSPLTGCPPALPITLSWLPAHCTGTQQPLAVWPGRHCPRLPARGQEMPGAGAPSLTPEPGAPPRCAS